MTVYQRLVIYLLWRILQQLRGGVVGERDVELDNRLGAVVRMHLDRVG